MKRVDQPLGCGAERQTSGHAQGGTRITAIELDQEVEAVAVEKLVGAVCRLGRAASSVVEWGNGATEGYSLFIELALYP